MAINEIDLGNVKGPKGDQGPKGDTGPQGPQGPQGEKGEVDAETSIAFTAASTRANIVSGESIKTIFGKIAKWFTDLKTGAFTTVVNNLTTTAASTVLDGRQGKALNDKITAINSALVTVRTVNEWTMTEYPNGLIEAWRYTTLSSASGAKTNTLSLPTPMKDSEYGVKISPIFNGHLCHAVWAGSKTGADGRTKTTVQISMDSTDSDSNVGVFVFISGYRQ